MRGLKWPILHPDLQRGENSVAQTPVNVDITGSIWKLRSKVGDNVNAGDVLLVMESMKMEIEVNAPAAGVVKEIHVREGDLVNEGDAVVTLETS